MNRLQVFSLSAQISRLSGE